MSVKLKASFTAEVVLAKKKLKRERDRDREREVKTVSCPMSEAWSAMSGLHFQRTKWEMLLSQLPCGHPDKRSLNQLMPWLIVAYALCTTLADHPDTQSIIQTTRLCPRCEAKVAVPWQRAYWIGPETPRVPSEWSCCCLHEVPPFQWVSRNSGFVQVIQSISNTPAKAHFAWHGTQL